MRDDILKSDKETAMSSDTICKTVCQYNKERVPDENMEKLLEIAKDYAAVKNYMRASGESQDCLKFIPVILCRMK